MGVVNFLSRALFSLLFLVLVWGIVVWSNAADTEYWTSQTAINTIRDLSTNILIFATVWLVGIAVFSTLVSTPLQATTNFLRFVHCLIWIGTSLLAIELMYLFMLHGGGYAWSGGLAFCATFIFAVTPNVFPLKLKLKQIRMV